MKTENIFSFITTAFRFSKIIDLTVQLEKLTMVMERLRLTQNATLGAPAFSVSDLSGPLDSRNLVPSLGMNMYLGAKMQKSLDQIPTRHNLSLMESRTEKWKMPLSFKCVGTFRFVFICSD